MNKLYGFEGEVKTKYDDKVYELFQQTFNTLPLGYLISKKILVVHGVRALVTLGSLLSRWRHHRRPVGHKSLPRHPGLRPHG